MPTFSEVFHGKRSATSDESIKGAFYENIDLESCGLKLADGNVAWDDSVENNYYTLDDREFQKFLEDRKSCPQYITPYEIDGYNPLGPVQVLFIETGFEILFEMTDVQFQEDWNDQVREWKVTATTGYVVWVDTTWDQTEFLEAPMKYQSINRYYYCDIMNDSSLNAPGSSHTICIPYFKMLPIPENEDMSNLLKWSRQLFPSPISTKQAFASLSEVPAPLRAYFLRKNKRMWNAAHRIASAWSRAYWSPYTEVGRRRLAKRFLE